MFGARRAAFPVTEFAVVVVLDDDRAVCPRKLEQRHPARERQVHAQRKLMRGRHANHFRIPRQTVDSQPLVVDRNRNDFRARFLEHVRERRITRSFDRDRRRARRDQDAGEEIEGLLSARGDHDVIRMTRNRSCEGDVMSDGFAQRHVPVWFAVPKARPLRPAQRSRGKTPPNRVGKRFPLGHTHPEIETAVLAHADPYQR